MNGTCKLTAMALVLAALLVAGTVVGATSPSPSRGDGIQWFSYAEGLRRGEAENKKTILEFHADWCRYCAKMEKETFQDYKVIQYVNDNYVAIKVDFDTERKLATKYQIRALPATFVIEPDGSQIGPIQGFISKEGLLQVLKQNQ